MCDKFTKYLIANIEVQGQVLLWYCDILVLMYYHIYVIYFYSILIIEHALIIFYLIFSTLNHIAYIDFMKIKSSKTLV